MKKIIVFYLFMFTLAIFCISKYGWRYAGINELNQVRDSLKSQQHQITYLFEELDKIRKVVPYAQAI